MKKVLYIHGFNSSGRTGKFLEEELGKLGIEVIHPSFSPCYEEAKRLAEQIIAFENVSLVVGSSLGAFTALNCKGIPVIAINPCMHPDIELPKIGGELAAKTYVGKLIENEKDNVYGLFGTDDELLDYRDEFSVKFDYNKMHFVQGGKHSLANEQLKKFLFPIVLKILEG